MRRRSATRALSVLLLVALRPTLAGAQPEPEKLSAAKALFREGVTLFETGDLEGALADFRRSRATYASSQNTLNAAICLERLGRAAEALALYDALVAEFYRELSEPERRGVRAAVAELRGKVAYVEITSNVRGDLSIDGETRGRLPLALPVRVKTGEHAVRVTKNGYTAFSGSFVAGSGETARVEAHLEPLGSVGEVRVEDTAVTGSVVVVDGVRVGVAPWDGLLPPGRHVLWSLSRDGQRGSPPTRFMVVGGQTALVRVASRALGAAVHVEAQPPSAVISLDGIPVATHAWSFRLPPGPYSLEVAAPGYVPEHRTIEVPTIYGQEAWPKVVLDRDVSGLPTHARDDGSPHPFVTLGLGYLALMTPGPSGCNCAGGSGVRGLAELRGGVLFHRVGLEVEAGFVSFGMQAVSADGTPPASQFEAGYLAGGFSLHMPVSSLLSLVPRVSAGSSEVFIHNAALPTSPQIYGRVMVGLELAVGNALLGLDLGVTYTGSFTFFELPLTASYVF